MTGTNRRTFLKTSTAGSLALGAFGVGPAIANEQSDKLNFAIIGCSGRGGAIGNEAVKTGMANVVALCDANPSRTARFQKDHPDWVRN